MNSIQSKSDEKLKISNRQNPETLGTREQSRSTLDFEGWELDDLVDYILNTHHYFAWVNLPIIKEYALKTARNQGALCPQTIEVNRQFKELASSIEDHLQTQEHKIFPAIKQLVFASRDGYQINMDSIESLVLNMEAEHKCFSSKLKLVVSLLSSTEASKQPDSLPGALLEKLTAFEKNFNQHVKLEHNVLFPKALRLEKKIRALGS